MMAIPIDSNEYRQALATFATGITVVTTIDNDGQPRGLTANSFTSVSLDPPLISVCVAKRGAACDVFSATNSFSVNVLAEDQQNLSTLFASPCDDRFSELSWQPGVTGSPIIASVISWFECEMHNVVEAGDHVILIGQVVAYDCTNQSPLVYCSGAYVRFGLAQRALEAAGSGSSTCISAIVDHNDGILLQRDLDSRHLSLPTARHVGDAENPGSLLGILANNGVDVMLPFVCSVYEDKERGVHNVVYRGKPHAVDETQMHQFSVFPLTKIPWAELVDQPLRTLLKRYIDEREQDAFGVYVGDTESGKVHTINSNE